MNKKIINATPCEADGIKFKSKLEKAVYLKLRDLGYSPNYEAYKMTVSPLACVSFPFYDKETKSMRLKRVKDGGDRSTQLVKNGGMVRQILHCADFFFKHGDYDVFIEAKGIPSDRFKIVQKLFLWKMESLYEDKKLNPVYFMVYSAKQVEQVDKILKELYDEV